MLNVTKGLALKGAEPFYFGLIRTIKNTILYFYWFNQTSIASIRLINYEYVKYLLNFSDEPVENAL